jgi:hypothetical protein
MKIRFPLLFHTLVIAWALALTACGKSTPPRDALPSDATAPVTSASVPADAGAPVLDAGVVQPGVDAGGDVGPAAGEDAGAAAAEVADNKVAPTEGAELMARAKGLFEAIVNDDPERGEAFWFPKAPFVPLKDVKDPGKYWNQLHKSYVNDVHALHKKRKTWDGAELVKFEGWAREKWVPPGDEANHIGYYRAFHGKLRYKAGGEDGEMDVHTIITWQGRWYVTHLRKIKH